MAEPIVPRINHAAQLNRHSTTGTPMTMSRTTMVLLAVLDSWLGCQGCCGDVMRTG